MTASPPSARVWRSCIQYVISAIAARIGIDLMSLRSDATAVRLCLGALATVLFSCGCERAEPIEFVSSQMVLDLEDDDLRTEVQKVVLEHTGTALKPKMLGDDKFDFDQLMHGQAVYMKRCQQCHGVSGDGNGPVAGSLYPRPRDYRPGVFKFTTTPYGAKPRRSDLVRVVKRGVPGTSMPSFDRLADADLEAVVDYVLMLSRRGELEKMVGYEASTEDELDPDYLPEYIGDIKTSWHDAEYQTARTLTPMPEFTADHIEAGRKAFLTKGCSKCHGEDGRGHMPGNIGKDAWGFATRAADLTSGMLRGGQEPQDIYQRIYSGINGTPMPAFKSTLTKEPETLWNLVAYVLHVSNKRRKGDMPSAGLLKPFETAASEADTEEEGE